MSFFTKKFIILITQIVQTSFFSSTMKKFRPMLRTEVVTSDEK